MLKTFVRVSLVVCLFSPGVMVAQEDKKRTDTEERLSVLEEEIEKMKLNRAIKKYESVGGYGPAASAVYHTEEGLSIGGYGEIKHRDKRSSFVKNDADVHRFILYAGYRFNDWIVMNAEIEYEHSGIERKSVVTDVQVETKGTTVTATQSKSDVQQSEVYVEFAYVDFKLADWANFQVGLNLVPMGIYNYRHEPTTFHTVERPYTETNIIPSTWREIGILFHGQAFDGLLSYKTGFLTNTQATKFSDVSWIREGRTKGSKVNSEDWAYVGYFDVNPFEGFTFGSSGFIGESGLGDVEEYNEVKVRLNAPNPVTLLKNGGYDEVGLAYSEYLKNKKKNARIQVSLMEAHAMYELGPFSSRGLIARGWLSEEDGRAVNSVTGKNVGIEVEGGYVELGFNTLAWMNTQHRLVAYVRSEYVNTQKRTVERPFGGEDDLSDAVCAESNSTCKTTKELSKGNRDLGIISASDGAKELYGKSGVPDRSNDRRIMTYGLAYFPHSNVVLKGEYEAHDSKTNYHRDVEFRNPKNNKVDQVNVAVGFIF